MPGHGAKRGYEVWGEGGDLLIGSVCQSDCLAFQFCLCLFSSLFLCHVPISPCPLMSAGPLIGQGEPSALDMKSF